MKQIYRVDKSGNLAQAISEITAPKLLLLMSNNEQFEQHVEELERHFPGVPSIGCIGGSYGGQTVVADNGVAVIAMEGNLSVVTNVLEQASTMPVKYIGRLEEDINKVAASENNTICIDFCSGNDACEKGRGYKPAERNPSKFHGIGPFDVATGMEINKSDRPTYSQVFSNSICEIAKKDRSVCAITADMPDGVGLAKFSKWFPDRFFDVGIAEAHAVTFAAGLSAGGLKPVFAVYSSFLQRAYDQILHDVCIQQLHVVFAIDRAGLVGSDGETHQGIFDISFLSSIPNMTIMAPKNDYELKSSLEFALEEFNGPIAIRYPRGEAVVRFREFNAPVEYGKAELMYEESDIAILALGSMVDTAFNVRERLKEQGYNVTLVNARFVKPIGVISRLPVIHQADKLCGNCWQRSFPVTLRC